MAIILGFLLLSLSLLMPSAEAATMEDYCVAPPFVMQPVPPLVMLALGRDHKIYYEAFNDAYDLDSDGKLETTYKHSVDYYGYFDPQRCYTYNSTGTAKFEPVTSYVATDKFCNGTAGHWSGNVLNYLTMSKMDVIRKVFYGGHRVSASSNVLERAYIPQDAHSWGKEFTGRVCNSGTTYTNQCITDVDCDSGYSCVDKSINLIGMAAPAGVTTCTPIGKMCTTNANVSSGSCTIDADCAAGEQCVVPSNKDQILVAKYSHAASKTAAGNSNNHANLLASYEPENLSSYTYVSDLDANTLAIKPNTDKGDHFNFFAIAEWEVTAALSGNWQFAIDGDDAVELEIDGTVVASWYGAHGRCGGRTCNVGQVSGNVFLDNGNGKNSTEWHTLIVRHFEQTGDDGFTVWYKKPGNNTWYAFGKGSGQNTLNLRSPNIVPANECNLKSSDVINFGTLPTTTFNTGTAKRHLFCSTTESDGGAPLLKLLQNKSDRIWSWASKERPVCNDAAPFSGSTKYQVRVASCTSAEAAAKTDYFTKYCKFYPGGGGLYMPQGLLQKYGEGDGTKVCSKQFTQQCNVDNDCLPVATYGKCVDKTKMMFGMISGSYEKNLSGGVVRKNVWSVLDEIESNTGSFQNASNVSGDIIDTMEKLKIVGFNYTGNEYSAANGGSCGWITDSVLTEGKCKDWGNPMAEIMFEATRYFANKTTQTADFWYGTNNDAGLSLTKIGSGPGAPKTDWLQPYGTYPICARPFILTFSDISPSYDSDKLPGSYFDAGFTSDLTGLNVSTLADTIGTAEGIAGTNRFVGKSGSSTDTLCTSKSVSNLSSVQGICPEEPTKQGSFYSAAIAYYGKEKLKYCDNSISTICTTNANCPAGGKCTKRNLTTYSVALSSPVPDVNLKIGGKNVRFIPTGKSVSGCLNVGTNCASRCTVTRDADGVHLSNCAANAYCPTNQIVDFYVDTIRYDASNNVTYAKFRINFEDVEQGADHDMDAIVTYEIEPEPSDPTNKINVSLSSEYAAGCINQALGFIITGTTADGVYLPVRDADTASTDASIGALGLNWTKQFTVTGGATEVMKDPLWYAAKWGGFEDSTNDGTPDAQSEWDENNDGVPDTYFLVVNPQKMEKQIEEAFLSILRRASSGTAASVLASGEGSGANLVQAIFYPKRMFDKEIDWTGTLQNLWYYLDPRLGNSTIREDTVEDNELKLDQDYIVNMFFDTAEQRTKARRWASDAVGVPGTQQPTVYLEDLKYLWEAGSQLHARTAASRDIRVNYNNTLTSFTTGLASDATFRTRIQAANSTEATNIISYVRGESDGTGRNRTVTDNATGTINKIWKLGDIVNSTPKIVSWIPLNKYDLVYDDKTYTNFLESSTYQDRGTVFAGANDGMLHAFKLGTLGIVKDGTSKKATLTGSDLGSEQWAFIPKNALPYLKYLMDPDYCHLYYVDLTPFIFDASIEAPGIHDSDYWAQAKAASSWRTVLIGGMRLGGACKNMGTANPFGFATDVEAPIAGVGVSSYFALDITNPASPQLMWEFTNPNLGFSTTGPAIMRISARDPFGSTSRANKNKNGKWFVVLASGPTGPITDRQFKGYSDQPLSLFILDAKTGNLLRTINTGLAADAADQINYAFGGSLNNANIDYDFDYQDDALYLGYTKSEHSPPTAATRWTNGGVIRLVTREDLDGTNDSTTALNPDNWAWSHVIKDTGSVTASVAHLAHYRSGSTTPDLAWLYLGTGRYFYKGDDATARKIGGIKELCLRDKSAAILPPGLSVDSASQFYAECTNGSTTPPAAAQVAGSNLVDKTCGGLSGAGLAACVADPCVSGGKPLTGSNLINCLSDRSYKGWFIRLDGPPSERVITDPLAIPTGAVFFTTFAPSSDICKFGGSSYLWAVNYETGGSAGAALQGKALLQVSTGAIEEIELKEAFTEEGGRRTEEIDGVPPTGQGLAVVVPNKPINKIMHIRKE